MNKIVVIVGPTASGKTSLSVELAKKFNGEIISADSMQVYRGMDIGTAKVTNEEKQGITHHLIDILDPSEEFSLADYLDHVKKAVNDILSRGKTPFLVGGTGLYVSSFTDNIKLSPSKADPEYRAFLNDFAGKNGTWALKELLRPVDPESYAKLFDNDVKRISRALEIYRDTGKTVEEYNKESRQDPEFEFLKFGLTCANRDFLYERINNRVDIMMEQGLLDEVKRISSLNRSGTACQAIGYRQFDDYFKGNISLEQAIELVKQESRRYAKRQLTWFKRDKDIIWHNIDENNSEEIMNSCSKHMEKFLKV